MARSTYLTFLMYKGSGDTYSKLVDIKDFPDLGGAPEMLDATTLSDGMIMNILGIQSLDAMTFTANYDLADYKKIKALKGNQTEFAVWFGGTPPTTPSGEATPTGDLGKFAFTGDIDVFAAGGAVNAVGNMTITIAASTEIVLDED